MSWVQVQGISKARQKLAKLAAALRDHAGVVERAAAKVQAQVDAVSSAKLGSHEASGYAIGNSDATASGGLVLLKSPRYLTYHRWWPFRSGMPPFVVKRAASIFAAELLATLGMGSSEAQVIASEIAADDAASEAKKTARKAEAKQRREDRKIDRLIKAREAREDRGRG